MPKRSRSSSRSSPSGSRHAISKLVPRQVVLEQKRQRMTNENIRNILANRFNVGGLYKGNYEYVKKLPNANLKVLADHIEGIGMKYAGTRPKNNENDKFVDALMRILRQAPKAEYPNIVYRATLVRHGLGVGSQIRMERPFSTTTETSMATNWIQRDAGWEDYATAAAHIHGNRLVPAMLIIKLPASCPRLVLDDRMARLKHLENESDHIREQNEVIVYPGLLKVDRVLMQRGSPNMNYSRQRDSPNRNYSRHIEKLIVCHWTRDIKV